MDTADDSTLTLAAALARASQMINESRTVAETLDAIVHATRVSLPEFPHVSISLKRGDGTFETAAGTDQLVWELEELVPCRGAAGGVVEGDAGGHGARFDPRPLLGPLGRGSSE